MRLVTFQPNSVLRTLESGNDYIPTSILHESYSIIGFYPVFSIKLESTRQFMEEYSITCTSYPQSIVVFDTDDYITVSKLGWSKYCVTGDPLDIMNQHSYKEYIVNGIKASSFIGGYSITDSEDPMDIQDALIDFMAARPYEIINKYIPSNRREKIKVNLKTLSTEAKRDYAFLISKLNIRAEQTTNEDIERMLRSLAPKLLTKVGK